jgi:hypothetical protein
LSLSDLKAKEQFSNYPPAKKNRIVYALIEKKQLFIPANKEIIVDLLKHQADYTGVNELNFTRGAIDLTVAQHWDDLLPLLQQIYDKPRAFCNYIDAFKAIRTMSGNPVSAEIISSVENFNKLSSYKSPIDSEEVKKTLNTLKNNKDQEAAAIYLISHIIFWGGKGVSFKGQIIPIVCLEALDRDTVKAALTKLVNNGKRDFW